MGSGYVDLWPKFLFQAADADSNTTCFAATSGTLPQDSLSLVGSCAQHVSAAAQNSWAGSRKQILLHLEHFSSKPRGVLRNKSRPHSQRSSGMASDILHFVSP